MSPLESAVVAVLVMSPFYIGALALFVLRRAGVKTEGPR